MPRLRLPSVLCATNPACQAVLATVQTEIAVLQESHVVLKASLADNARDISEVAKKLDRLVWAMFSLVGIAAAQLLFYVITMQQHH